VRVAVVIPARNEEASLPLVLGAIPPELVEEVVVVDNASSDRTAEVARAAGASILFEPRPGYGAACLRGVGRSLLLEIGARRTAGATRTA